MWGLRRSPCKKMDVWAILCMSEDVTRDWPWKNEEEPRKVNSFRVLVLAEKKFVECRCGSPHQPEESLRSMCKATCQIRKNCTMWLYLVILTFRIKGLSTILKRHCLITVWWFACVYLPHQSSAIYHLLAPNVAEITRHSPPVTKVTHSTNRANSTSSLLP